MPQNLQVAKLRPPSNVADLRPAAWATALVLVACHAQVWPPDTRARQERTFDEFQRATRNYEPAIKRGPAGLGRATDSYAAYLQLFHRPLHLEFAHEFLERAGGKAEFADLALSTTLEIVIEPDGSLNRVGVVKSSGSERYDFEAFNSVQRGAPYPPPPADVRSADGRTYLRWTLHRNESQCGTWNAEPYILSDVR